MGNKTEVGLLLARITLGAIMLAHGVDKFMNLEMVVGMFTDVFELPAFLAYATAIVEVVAGAALILGLFVEGSAALVGIVMLGAIATVKWDSGFFTGWELDLALLGLAVALTFAGSRLFALTTLLKKRSHEINNNAA
ncbi:DoxX family protein [Bacillus spongiae]|uniref:DoxX family protein n=1 Tax=Bacillus spongiae TaxID=2683610 RepID=A0ABU8HAP7_9BACI